MDLAICYLPAVKDKPPIFTGKELAWADNDFFKLPEVCSNECFFEKRPRDVSMTSCPCLLLISVELVEDKMLLLRASS